ncbi:MAG: hypothetical protein ICV74_03240 [Thermoleophilia bacterium]|nr:hypothetical protein [Thermoleophilia bacterium]
MGFLDWLRGARREESAETTDDLAVGTPQEAGTASGAGSAQTAGQEERIGVGRAEEEREVGTVHGDVEAEALDEHDTEAARFRGV